ncbi:hypothetical protein RRG08_017710 [Elysia crispata]|uniref:Uncharacterized protein n=1 Tax=Elysia crispata TaxID=231223 RepID=A0AAE0YIS0_9GAST|nr:hypothetical protein RRG08_017710 [Elysia crispata]
MQVDKETKKDAKDFTLSHLPSPALLLRAANWLPASQQVVFDNPDMLCHIPDAREMYDFCLSSSEAASLQS